jgi:hypothetical protein
VLCVFLCWCADRGLVVWLLKPKIKPCSYLVNHDPNLNFPLSLHDQTHTNLGYGHTLFVSSGHDLFGSLLVTILTGGVSLYILSPLPNPLVSREISYWLRLVMVLWLKPMARADITVSSHNPLWDYIDMLSSVDLPLKRFRCCLSKWPSNICHHCWIKRAYHFHGWSYFFWSW